MAVKRSRSWLVQGGAAARVIDDFAARRELLVKRTRDGMELRGGADDGLRGREARQAREDRLPVRGSIAMKPERDGGLRVTASFRSDGAGLLGGRGPVGRRVKQRFEQRLGELLADLGQSLGAPY